MWSRPLVPCSSFAAALAVVLTAPSRPSDAAAQAPLPLFAAGAVKRALALAVERLGSEECRSLYDDFRDASGVTLGEKLRRGSEEPAQHLRSLRWLNGAEHPLCRDRRVFLVTYVGARVVLVCPSQFGDLAVQRPGQAAGLLLHEQLHTLGLGENPPASEDISRRVFARCGS
jgi:hypothetical protein